MARSRHLARAGIARNWIFWLNVPVAAVLIPLVLARVPESRGADTALDLPGVGLVTGGMLGVVCALVRATDAGWQSAEVLVTLVGGLAPLGGFVAWQLRAREPMLPMRFFRSRAFSAGNAAIAAAVGGLFCAVCFVSQFLQVGLGSRPLEAGLRQLPWTATLFFESPLAGLAVDGFGERPFLIAGPLLQAAGMDWIALIADAGMTYSQLIPPMIVAGVGISMVFPEAQSSVVSAVPEEALGKAAGTNSTMRELGGVLGMALLFGFEHIGASRFTFALATRFPFAHRRHEQEGALVVTGSGRVELHGDMVEVHVGDVFRVTAQVSPQFESRPKGLQLICVGGRRRTLANTARGSTTSSCQGTASPRRRHGGGTWRSADVAGAIAR